MNALRQTKDSFIWCRDLQSSDDDIEHGSEGLSSIGNVLVDNNAGEPNKQCPWKKQDTVQGA